MTIVACVLLLLPLCTIFQSASSLDNGLALTPPMGWMSWTRFACETDCDRFPKECINEELYKEMADMLADEGFVDVGYQFVNIDDCWSEKERDSATNRLVPDKKRFPSGIQQLSSYIHAKRLKFGIYSDIGTKTCAGYPGHTKEGGPPGEKPKNYFTLDADTFAEWEVDSLKVDGCYANTSDFEWMYPSLGQALNETGRPILYSCSWPAYQVDEGRRPDYESISQHCNLWRNFNDIDDSWQSILSIIDFYAKNQDDFANYHGPGRWFDPDMVIVGDFGLSLDQSRSQFSIWSILAAPLLLSSDLRTLTPQQKEILLNKHVIAVNQDELGKLGKRVITSDDKKIEVWTKELSGGSYAISYLHRGGIGNPRYVSYQVKDLIKPLQKGYESRTYRRLQLADVYYVSDLWDDGKIIAKLSPSDKLVLRVNPSGVRMVKLIPR